MTEASPRGTNGAVSPAADGGSRRAALIRALEGARALVAEAVGGACEESTAAGSAEGMEEEIRGIMESLFAILSAAIYDLRGAKGTGPFLRRVLRARAPQL